MAGTEQYRPITSTETAADQGYNVRAVRDQVENINNAAIYVFAHPLINIPCIPVWYSFDSLASENVITMTAPVRVPEPYNKLVFVVGNKRTAGSGTIDWTLYSSEWRYWGDGVLDATKLSPGYGSGTIECNSDTHDVPAATTLDVVRGVNGWCYLVLTATNASGADRGYISSFTVWPALI